MFAGEGEAEQTDYQSTKAMICLSARVAESSQGDLGISEPRLLVMCQPSSLYVRSSDLREAGDNSSGLRSGSGAEWK